MTEPHPADTVETPHGDGASTPSLAVQLRTKRSEMMTLELESVALRMFEERGFANVRVDEVAAAAQVSERTFYRYFPSKEDVMQVRVDRRSEALRRALAMRPADEPPLHSLRAALTEVVDAEDAELTRRWIAVIVRSPELTHGVLGGVQIKSQRAIAEFLGARLETEPDDLVPRVLAAAVGGTTQSTFSYWFHHGGDLAALMSESLEVLENFGVATDRFSGGR